MSDAAPKLHIDDDWKAQARAEKQQLADSVEKSQSAQATNTTTGTGPTTTAPTTAPSTGTPGPPGSPGGGGGAQGQAREMPPASFETLVSTMATQALFAMGAIPDPRTGQRHAQLDLARHHIDMLSVIEEKTKGNLSDDEQSALTSTLYELRSRYIQISNQARER